MRIPAPPSRPGAACVYITRGRDKRLITTWGDLHAARSQIDAVLDGEKFKWLDHETIATGTGIKIQCHKLEDIMELEPDGLQPQEQRTVDRFLSDAPDAAAPLSKREQRKARLDLNRLNQAAQTAPNPTPDDTPPRSSSTPPTVEVVAAKLGVHPRQLRRALRKSNLPKSGGVWVINEDAIPELKKILKK